MPGIISDVGLVLIGFGSPGCGTYPLGAGKLPFCN
jgi:hypothetical protein